MILLFWANESTKLLFNDKRVKDFAVEQKKKLAVPE